MINKAMIEIPPKFAGQAPVGPIPDSDKHDKNKSTKDALEDWSGAKGLAEDVRRYGHWMREEAFKRIGHLYPKVSISDEMIADRPDLQPYAGQELTVIAWIWARTVKSPSPAFSHVDVPLVRSFILSTRKGKEAWVEPVIQNDGYRFVVRMGKPPRDAIRGTVLRLRAGGTCIISRAAMPFTYIRNEGKAGNISKKLMAVVAEGKGERVYLSPIQKMEDIAKSAIPKNAPESNLPEKALGFRVQEYGMLRHRDLFTPRQLLALTTFSDLVQEARTKVIDDARKSGWDDDEKGLCEGGTGATAYGDAVAVYLAFCVDRCTDFNNSFTGWRPGNEKIMYLFARHAIPMVWDFGEANILERVVGGFITNLEYQVKCLLQLHGDGKGYSSQQDAANQDVSTNKVISTDPPYYDNIGYADLSDFFYIWMRRSLKKIYPDLFSTIAVPKTEELIASSYRQGNSEKAENFFLEGMTQAMSNMANKSHPAFPVSIYYAFKQSETKEGSTTSTGWVTFLEAVIRAGFLIGGTWPARSEQSSRINGVGSNALASSIVLVCRKRPSTAETMSRRDFQRQLREEMPNALEAMVGGETGQTPIAPVDLAQAAIGPGMGIFSQYDAVLNQNGSKMSVHDALVLINRTITEYLSPESGTFDADTQFCSSWFDQYGWSTGPFGEANVLAQAKGTSIDGVNTAGVVESGGGKVRLLKWAEYEADWDPTNDNSTPVWEACHQMIRNLNNQGEFAAGKLLAKMPAKGEPIRQLAYHLYTLCERKKWAEDARAYNELVGSWHAYCHRLTRGWAQRLANRTQTEF